MRAIVHPLFILLFLPAILSAADHEPSIEELIQTVLSSPTDAYQALSKLEKMHGQGNSAIPLLLELRRSNDPVTRERAAWILWCLVSPADYYPLIDAAELTGIDPDGVNVRIDESKPITAELAFYYRALGNERAQFILKTLKADQTPLAKAAADIAKLQPHQRFRLAALLHSQDRSSPRNIELAAELLVHGDSVIARMAASIITVDAERYDRYAILRAAVASGKPPSPEILKNLQLDPQAACRLIAPLLKFPNAKLRLAAMTALKSIGLHGPEIRPALQSLLDDPEDPIRYAAADLLERKDIANRAAIPELLKDLRHDDPSRRATAARQFDELHVEPSQITAALIRATDSRNMPARQGLILAIESAHAARTNTLETLTILASDGPDPATKAYARAALREINAK